MTAESAPQQPAPMAGPAAVPAKGGATPAGAESAHPATQAAMAAVPRDGGPAAAAAAKEGKLAKEPPAAAEAGRPEATGSAMQQRPATQQRSVTQHRGADEKAGGPAGPERAPHDRDQADAVQGADAKRAEVAGGAAAGQPAGGTPDPADAVQVSVVPGITRYHKNDCLLIRFLSADDLQVMTRRQATDGGCVPCKACKPDQEAADLAVG